jgi:CHAT domain-containing protein
VEPGAAGGDDGWLTADEVVTLDLRGTRRVVLSACQSGVADRWTQEAVLGLRRAFHLAGARCVIASQWAIADEATRDWMEAFYASRAADSGGALREAGRTVLASRRARGLSTHPFYWAAFTATGE